MTLVPGTRIGPYEIPAPIGAGGMGEVYRARDTGLDRDVAIRMLPALFSKDAEGVARFRREAQVLASLNHPMIAAIHGLEDSEGVVAGAAAAGWLTSGPDPRPQLAQLGVAFPELAELYTCLGGTPLAISPDGRWLTCTSDDSGRMEVCTDTESSGRLESRGEWSPA